MIHTHAIQEATSTWINTMMGYTLFILFGILIYNIWMGDNE